MHGVVLWRAQRSAPSARSASASRRAGRRRLDGRAVRRRGRRRGRRAPHRRLARVFAAVARVEGLELAVLASNPTWFRRSRTGATATSNDRCSCSTPSPIRPAVGWPSTSSRPSSARELAARRRRCVCVGLPTLRDSYLQADDRFNAEGADLELAAKLAWLGDPDRATAYSPDPRSGGAVDPEPHGPHHAPRRRGGLAVANGDEDAAAACSKPTPSP